MRPSYTSGSLLVTVLKPACTIVWRVHPSAPPRPRPWTSADLARFPNDGNRYEVLNGELLVTPQANLSHQHFAMVLAMRLAPYCKRHSPGLVVAPSAVPKGKSELQPDVQVVPCTPEQVHLGWTNVGGYPLVSRPRAGYFS